MSATDLKISADALFLAGSLFNMMEPGIGSLTFRMQESRPTARTQAALDELVAVGAVNAKPFNDIGGVVYTPMRRFDRTTKKQAKAAGKWPIVEPIRSGE